MATKLFGIYFFSLFQFSEACQCVTIYIIYNRRNSIKITSIYLAGKAHILTGLDFNLLDFTRFYQKLLYMT